MAENENLIVENNEVVTEQPQPTPPAAENDGFGAKVKEFFRKRAVSIKRKPQNIALFYLAIVSIYNLITLTSFSNAVITNAMKVEWIGLMVFVTTLFSILILVSYLNAFPKLKQHDSKVVVTMTEGGVKLHVNLLMVAVVLLMAIAMIVCDIVYYNLMHPFYQTEFVNKFDNDGVSLAYGEAGKLINSTFGLSIAHIILLGIFLVLFLTLPLYRKLIMMINTSKVVEGNDIKEVIDTED